MVPPLFMVLKVTNAVLAPLHTAWLTGWSTCPAGFTVIVNVCAGPTHENVGITSIVAVMGASVLFSAVKEIFPLPLAPKPMDVLLFVQL